MLIIIDNYDSFTYNLVHLLGEIGAPRMYVYRNDEKKAEEILNIKPEAIVLSPGPCTPDQAGICVKLCRLSQVPLLGVCLGHQSLAQAFGARVIRSNNIFHGKTSNIEHYNQGIFRGLSQNFIAARYHSLIIDPQSLPDELIVDASTDDQKTIMAIRHLYLPLYGVQFHPESIATTEGASLLINFLEHHQLRKYS